MDLSKLPAEETASPEAGAFRLLAIGLLLALLVQPFMFIGGVANFEIDNSGKILTTGIDWIGKLMSLAGLLGMALIAYSLKNLLHLSDRLGKITILAAATTLLHFIMLFGNREILLRRGSLQIVHHEFGLMGLRFDKLAYLLAALLVYLLFGWLREWAMLRKIEPLMILLRERVNHYLIYFAAAIAIYSVGIIFTPLFVYLRFPLMLWGIFSIIMLATSLQRVAREYEEPTAGM